MFTMKTPSLIAAAIGVSLVAMTAMAQPRLGGVPSAADIVKALQTPAGGAGESGVRTRGLMLDKSAKTEGAAAKPAAKAEPTARAVDLDIQFASGSDRLTPEGRAVLDQLGEALKSDALADVSTIVLEGHTDAVGNAKINQMLSLRRARSAQAYLSGRHKIDAAKMQPVGKGSTELADPANPSDGVNRRVRIIVEG